MSYGPVAEPNVIYLQYPTAVCCICGITTVSQWGIPVSSETAEIVANEFSGEWGAVPACRECHDRHAVGEYVGSYPRF